MDLNPVAAVQAPQVTQTPPVARSFPENSKPENAQPYKKSDSVALTAPLPEKSYQLGQLNAGSNSIALNVKETDQKLAVVADGVDKMKGALEVIVKNNPPFPPESRDRMEYLMSFASLHKEIAQLTVPAPPPPVYEKVKHLWEQLFQKDSPGQIKLPGDLGHGSSDADLKAAVSGLESLHAGIVSIRSDVKQSLLETRVS